MAKETQKIREETQKIREANERLKELKNKMDENTRKVYISEELLQRIEAVANRSQVSKGQAIAMALDLLEKT